MLLFSVLLSLLSASLRVRGDSHCQHTQVLQPPVDDLDIQVVRFNGRPCDADFHHLQNHVFCEDSGWGDEEATVVCRNQLHSSFGIGGYVHIEPAEVGLPWVRCLGSEAGLEQCAFAMTTTMTPCSRAGIVRRCLNVSEVLVSRAEDYKPFDHVEVLEGESAEFCVVVWGKLSEPVHVLVETADSGHAVADYDYRPLRETVTFAPTESFRSHQCLQIEIMDDSLAEFWEMFSVTLSTNSSAVNLTRHEFNVYIHPSDGTCTESGVIISTAADNGSLLLVEMCQSQGVWSPLCDNDWTPQDATVVCRQLGYQDSAQAVFSTLLRKDITNLSTECSGNETLLASCPTLAVEDTTCRHLLVDCLNHTETDNNTKTPVIINDNSTNDGGIDGGTKVGNESGADVGDIGEESENGDTGDGEFRDNDSGGEGGSASSESGEDKNSDRDVVGSGGDPTTDITEEEATSSTPPEVASTTSTRNEELSVAVLSAVAASVVAVLLLTLTSVFLLVYVRRKRKQIATAKVEDSTDPHGSGGDSKAGGEKHLDNPTYSGSLESPEVADIAEYHVVNPLYDLSQELTETQLYAVLECPNYAIPGEVRSPLSPSNCEPVVEIGSPHNYEYADIPAKESNVV